MVNLSSAASETHSKPVDTQTNIKTFTANNNKIQLNSRLVIGKAGELPLQMPHSPTPSQSEVGLGYFRWSPLSFPGPKIKTIMCLQFQEPQWLNIRRQNHIPYPLLYISLAGTVQVIHDLLKSFQGIPHFILPPLRDDCSAQGLNIYRYTDPVILWWVKSDTPLSLDTWAEYGGVELTSVISAISFWTSLLGVVWAFTFSAMTSSSSLSASAFLWAWQHKHQSVKNY